MKRCFTLLEVMLTLAILSIVAVGIGGWKMHQVLEQKRFRSDLTKLQSRLFTCHRLAMNMQADWEGILEKRGKGWVFIAHCIDQPEVQRFAPIAMGPFLFLFEGEAKERWVIEFSATGAISPSGIAQFVQKKNSQEEWEIPGLFAKEAGFKKGPVRPVSF